MKKLMIGLLLAALFLTACSSNDSKKSTDNKSDMKVQTNSTKKDITQTQTDEVKKDSSIQAQTDESKQGDNNTQKNTQQEETKRDYYASLKDVWQRQKDYIDSIDDPITKQLVHTMEDATIAESKLLLLGNPKDTKVINEALQKILADGKTLENKQKEENVQKNTQQGNQAHIKEEAIAKEYYDFIKADWKKQSDYIKSINDPKIQVQSSVGAAVGQATILEMRYPEDTKAIREALQKVLSSVIEK